MFEREKTLEALRFFHENVRHASHIKLLKLLFYMDLVHFRRTGRTVTGLQYEAWQFGPVPRALWNEIKDPASDLHQHFEITDSEAVTMPAREVAGIAEAGGTYYRAGRLTPRSRHQHQYLTRRELSIAAELAEVFCDATSEIMSEASHNRFGPWRRALRRAQTPNDKPVVDLSDGDCGIGHPETFMPPDVLIEAQRERAENQAIV